MTREIALREPGELTDILLDPIDFRRIAADQVPVVRKTTEQLMVGTSSDKEISGLIALAMGMFKIPSTIKDPETFSRGMAKVFARYPAVIGAAAIQDLAEDPANDWLPAIGQFRRACDRVRDRVWDKCMEIQARDGVGGIGFPVALYDPHRRYVCSPPPVGYPFPGADAETFEILSTVGVADDGGDGREPEDREDDAINPTDDWPDLADEADDLDRPA